VQAWLEKSAWGRALISLLLLAIVGAIVVVNLPNSQLKEDLGKAAWPFVNATGLDQNWAVYSEPRTTSAYVEAKVEFADGSTTEVGIPHSPGIAAYADYRWQKFEEIIRPDSGKALWPAYAEYVAKSVRKGGHEPVRVSLIRRWSDTRPPGPGPVRDPWSSFTFYVLNVQPAT
jgi:hypothetical protein